MPPRRKQVHIRYPKSRSRVIFSRTAMASQDTSPPSPPPPIPPAPTSQLESLFESTLRFEELPSNSPSPAPPSTAQSYSSYYPYNPGNPYVPPPPAMPPAPPLFTTLPFLHDAHVTPSSRDQDTTASSCVRFLSYPEDPFPVLDRAVHIAFLESGLDGDKNAKLPEYMVALDASRPWIIYWCLCGLASLGLDVKQRYRSRVVASLRPLQNRTGGFGGGNGQMSHLTATYSAVLALAIVGGPISDSEDSSEEDEEDPLDIIDRLALLRFLHSVKMDTGAFRVALRGEADVRGAYCALTIITLLRLPTADGLLTGTREYLGRCQTYEGGFGAMPAGNEAHGGYAFCALAALCMLGEPREVLRATLDLKALVSWLSARQYAPEGGLSGRTNKLVDGCYSTWVGGCWALVEAALNGPQDEVPVGPSGELGPENKGVVGSLWSREGLARYILTCCQAMRGGMRDKPGKYDPRVMPCVYTR